MLSSLGARRDRSRSPPEGHPPSKVFVQAKETAQHLTMADVGHQSQRPNTKSDVQCHETFVPKIVVQEYTQEKGPSPTMPFTYAQALMQKRPESTGQLKSAALKQEAEENEFLVQHQPPQQGQDIAPSVQSPEVLQRQEVSARTQQQKQKVPTSEKQQPQELQKYEVQQTIVTSAERGAEVEQRNECHKQTREATVSKPALSSQELKSRKAKAMKNRPWLQKPASGECPPEVQKQVSVQGSTQTTQLQSKRETERTAHATSEPIAVAQGPPEEQVKVPEHPQQQQADQQRSTKELGNSKNKQKEVKHHEMVAHPQQQLSQQDKQPKQKKQSRKQEHQHTVHIVKQSDISSDPTVQSGNLPKAQLDQQTEPKNLPHPQTPVQSKSQAPVQEKVKPTGVTHSITDGPPPLRVIPVTQVTPGKSQAQDHTKSQVPTHLQPCIPEASQPSTQPQGVAPGLAVTQAPAWSQVGSPSPMQVSAQGQFPVTSHIQVRSHPQSWAPVRPPSPKPPQISAPMAIQPGTQTQSHFQSVAQPPTHSTSSSHSQAYVQSLPQTQAYAQQMAQQSHPSPLMQQTQDQFGVLPGTHHSTPFQSAVQHQGHISQSHVYSWNQVGASSPMPIHYTSYPEGYSQSQAMPPQWIPEKTLQTQTVGHHLVSQQYPQQSSQAPKTEAYPCWPQSGSQVDPQMGQHGYSHMAYSQSNVQMLNQPWTQTPPQSISGQISAYQQPAIRGYEVFQTQTHQSQGQQQPWSQVPPQMQSHSNLQSQAQHYSQHQTPHQTQSTMQTQTPFQLQAQVQPYPQPSPHAKPKTDPQPQFQKQPQHPGPQVQHLQKPQFQQPPPLQKPPSQFQPKQNIQPAQPQGEFPEQLSHQPPQKTEPASKLQSEKVPLSQAPKQKPPEAKAQAKPLPQPKAPVEPPSEAQIPTQQKQVQLSPQPQAQSPPLPKAQVVPPLGVQSPPPTDALQPKLNKLQEPTQVKTQAQGPQTKPKAQSPPQPEQLQSQVNLLTQVNVLPRSLPESPDLCVTPPALAQAPPQAYTEAYTKAQALARNGFEEAKHCLQEHIRETINVFEDKRISAKQGSLNKVNAIILLF